MMYHDGDEQRYLEDDYYAYNDRGDTEYDSIGGLIFIFMFIMIVIPLALGLIDKYTNWLK